jgi:hypothetical protein
MRPDAARVDGEGRVTVGLELEVGLGSIRGRVTDALGNALGFSGWLALLAALEELSSSGHLTVANEGVSEGGL